MQDPDVAAFFVVSQPIICLFFFGLSLQFNNASYSFCGVRTCKIMQLIFFVVFILKFAQYWNSFRQN